MRTTLISIAALAACVAAAPGPRRLAPLITPPAPARASASVASGADAPFDAQRHGADHIVRRLRAIATSG